MRRSFLAIILLVASASLGAQEYPARTVRMVVPYAPGGGVTDHDNKTKRRVLNGMLSIVLDPARFGTQESFARDAKSFLGWLRASRPAPGHDRVRIAGEPERESRAQREREGIPVDEETWNEIRVAAGKLKLDPKRVETLAQGG